MNLNENFIPFGKYKGLEIDSLLRDRKYCSWLLLQPWFLQQYPYLCDRVKNYNPEEKYAWKNTEMSPDEFVKTYPLFFLEDPPLGGRLQEQISDLKDVEIICYNFYREQMVEIKNKIKKHNSFDIKAPKSWLKKLEKDYSIPRDVFKEFLQAYGLPNITSVIETVKKHGGIEYKGAKSFLIAKENSVKQEEYWERRLKGVYGDGITCQYVFNHCIFDFLNIKLKVLYECKLNLKDFDEAQYKKYLVVMNQGMGYKMVYLIGKDTIIDMERKEIFTKDKLFCKIINKNKPNKLEIAIENFSVKFIKSITEYLYLER